MTKESGGTAFPVHELRSSAGEGFREGSDGMTLRDYFAAAAVPALIKRFGIMDGPANKIVAEQAFEIADAMLAERAKVES